MINYCSRLSPSEEFKVKFYTEEPQRIEVRQIEGCDGVRTSAFPSVVSSDSPPIGAERRGWLSATSSGLTIGQACATVEACTSSVRTFVHVWRGDEEKKMENALFSCVQDEEEREEERIDDN
jgi:hypothetical protein